MPELPEVQTVVSQLGRKIVGRTIRSFETEWAKAVRPSMVMFEAAVVGAKILSVRRIGKHIVIDLDGGNDRTRKRLFSRLSFGASENAPHPDVEKSPSASDCEDGRYISIVIHLKMTGHLLVKDRKNAKSESWSDPYNQFIRHRFELSGGLTIDFSDMRKFAWMEMVPSERVEHMASVSGLGVDALSPRFTQKYFDTILEEKSKQKVGVLLLDQSNIAGIGNIYRCEALFVAGVLPGRIAATLVTDERARLFRAIKFVLRRAVRFRGTSDGDFRDTDGLPGGFQRRLGVYGRGGKPCPRCGTMITREKLGSRSVFFCPQCQK